ncbi:MAG: hypothetical protein KDK71_10265, partial [Chlamydiia bacterium]|nr:hypothetical protein [Chlamydiia bacterium]
LCLLEQAGILSSLLEKGSYGEEEIDKAPNPPLLRSALVTLVDAGILKWEDETFLLTDFGRYLGENIGTFLITFVGYRKLLAKQEVLLNHPKQWDDSEIDYQSVAVSSINFGHRFVDPILIEIVKEMHPKGTICDLGCGTAEKLVNLCAAAQTSGLGFEKDQKVVKKSKAFTKGHPEVEVIEADITKLKGIWEDVEIGFIGMVLHDFDEEESLSFLRSLTEHFPRMRSLIIFDIVTMSKEIPTILPGFDYVHGLQGIRPRTHRENLEIFEKAGYALLKEVVVPHMPNTYIWVLKNI